MILLDVLLFSGAILIDAFELLISRSDFGVCRIKK